MLWKRRSDDKDVRWLEYIDGLYSYGVVLTGDREEAEDLVKNVYDYAMKAMASVRNCSNVRIWMFSILRSFWRNQLYRKNLVSHLVEMEEKKGSNRSNYLEDRHFVSADITEKNELLDAVQQLPVELREIILLREFESLSYREIAGILCCEVKAVATRLAIARSSLHILLASRSGKTKASVSVRHGDLALMPAIAAHPQHLTAAD